MQVGKLDKFPFYDPWVGADYADRKRRLAAGEHFSHSNWFLHVLGESHYIDGSDENSRDLTKRVVCRYSDPKGPTGVFFNRVLQTFQGCDYYSVKKADGWSDIAFSNYVQNPLSASRVKPTNGDWEDAACYLVGQLTITKPRVLLVLGTNGWGWFKSNHQAIMEPVGSLDILKDGKKVGEVDDAHILAYTVDEKLYSTIVVWAYHPSGSKFDWQAAHDCVVAADMFHDNLVIAHGQRLAPQSS